MKTKVKLLCSSDVGCVCANWVIFHGTAPFVDVAFLCLWSLIIDYLKFLRICWVVDSVWPQRLHMFLYFITVTSVSSKDVFPPSVR